MRITTILSVAILGISSAALAQTTRPMGNSSMPSNGTMMSNDSMSNGSMMSNDTMMNDSSMSNDSTVSNSQ